MKRNLHADLAICDDATSGPWEWRSGNATYRDLGAIVSTADGDVCDFGNCARYYPTAGNEPCDTDIVFMTKSRQGWPEAIRRAIVAEAEVERLRTALETTQYHLYREQYMTATDTVDSALEVSTDAAS